MTRDTSIGILQEWMIWVTKESWPGCMGEALKFAVEDKSIMADQRVIVDPGKVI